MATSNWFGGVWRDERSFFAQFAVDSPQYFAMYPEFVFEPGQWADYLRDRRGAAVGRQLADLYGFMVGDRMPIRGTIYPGTHEFTVRAIYEGRDAATITRQMYFHYDYLNEFLKARFPDMKRLSDIPLPPGVELVDLVHGRDEAVVSIHHPRAEEAEAPAAEAGAAAPAAGAAAPAAGGEAKKEEAKPAAAKKEGGKK